MKHFECLASNTDHVMQALERSGSELQFAAAALRADPYLVAWAGAPVGASECRTLPAELVLLMKAAAPALSVAFVEANSQMVFDAYQRMGTKSDGWGQKGDGEEIFQGLERFE